jgi:hypothetical protein
MDGNFGLVHKRHSGCGPGREHVCVTGIFVPDSEVHQFVDQHTKTESRHVSGENVSLQSKVYLHINGG